MADVASKLFTCLMIIFASIVYSQTEAKNIPLGSNLYTQNTPWLSSSGIFAFGFYKKADGFAVGTWMQTAGAEPLITWTANRHDPPIPSDAYLELTRDVGFAFSRVLDVWNLTKRKRKMILILAPPFSLLLVLFTLLAVFSFFLYRRRALKYQKLLNMENLGLDKEFTLRSFSYSELDKAADGCKRVMGNIS